MTITSIRITPLLSGYYVGVRIDGARDEERAYSNPSDLLDGLREMFRPRMEVINEPEPGGVVLARPETDQCADWSYVKKNPNPEWFGSTSAAKPDPEDDGWREWEGSNGYYSFPPKVDKSTLVQVLFRGVASGECARRADEFRWEHRGQHWSDITHYRVVKP